MSNNFNQLLRQKLIENFHKKMLSKQVPGPSIIESLNRDMWYEPGYTPPQPPPPPVQYNDDDYTPGQGSDYFPPVTYDEHGRPTRWFYGPQRDNLFGPNYLNNPFRPPPAYKIPRRPGFDPNWPNVRGLPRYGPAIYPWDPSRPP